MANRSKNVSQLPTREDLERDVAAFLKAGKKIQEIPTGVSGQIEQKGRKHLVLGPSRNKARTAV